jgi:hypothetical protein
MSLHGPKYNDDMAYFSISCFPTEGLLLLANDWGPVGTVVGGWVGGGGGWQEGDDFILKCIE